MPLFCQDKSRAVQSFIIKVVNNNCPELKAMLDGPRIDRRVNLTVAVRVIPLEKKKLQIEEAFSAITKEFSATGVAIVVERPQDFQQAILCFRWEGEMHYARATVKHLTPLGGGFYQLGFLMTEMIRPNAYPQLEEISL